jgi:hypothetical protein
MRLHAKHVPQFAKNSNRCAAMNVWVEAIDVAQRPLNPICLRFEHEPAAPCGRDRDSQPKLERHIEPRCSGRCALDSRQIVNGDRTTADKRNKPRETMPRGRDLQNATGRHPETR